MVYTLRKKQLSREKIVSSLRDILMLFHCINPELKTL